MSSVDPVLGFERLFLLGVNRDRTVHLMQSLFSVPVGLYSTSSRFFACIVNLPGEVLPPMVEITVEAFALCCAALYVPRTDLVSHPEGVTLLT